MENFKGTKGEWKCKLENTANLVYSETNGAICQINHLDRHLQEHNANTKLLAASKDLLDALVELSKIVKNAGHDLWIEQSGSTNAIKKATL